MARMGHDDMRAALIYQRATSEADAKIADRLSRMVDAHRTDKAEEDQAADGGQDQAGEDEDGGADPVPVG